MLIYARLGWDYQAWLLPSLTNIPMFEIKKDFWSVCPNLFTVILAVQQSNSGLIERTQKPKRA
jgi:hypothetical protein